MTLNEVMVEIISRCENECTDARSTYDHFLQLKHYHGEQLDMKRIQRLVSILNFAAIREGQHELFKDFSAFHLD